MAASLASASRLLAAKPRLPRWCVGVLVLLMSILLYSHGQLETHLLVRPHQKNIEQALEGAGTAARNRLDTQLSSIISRLETLSAEARTHHILSLEDNNPSQWANNARVLDTPGPRQTWLYDARARLPEARRIYLLDPGQQLQLLQDNFVAERLYSNAMGGGAPAPIAAKVETWRIYFARPVREAEAIKGVVLIEVDPVTLSSELTKAAAFDGSLQLVQNVKNFPSGIVFSEGRAAPGGGIHNLTLATGVPDWELRLAASTTMMQALAPSPIPFHLLFAVLCASALALAGLMIRRHLYFLQGPHPQRASNYNPMDDLFTERHQRIRLPAAAATRAEEHGDEPEQILPPHVFRDYDIRGKAYLEITGDFADTLGRVLGTMVLERGGDALIVCCDGRRSSPILKKALIHGIASTGCNVLDIGEGPTPMMNFAAATRADCDNGVMVTASHNPKDDNGFKIIMGNHVLSSGEIRLLHERMVRGDYQSGSGGLRTVDVRDTYLHALTEGVAPLAPLHVAIDCGNGIAGSIAPALFRKLGCRVDELFTEVDGDFPNHPPDPTDPANLTKLIDTIAYARADIGLAFDGDGDRLVAVTGSGKIVWPDQLMMIFARDILGKSPGTEIVFDVKSSRHLEELIASYGGKPVMWKTGHAHTRNKVKETGAPLGGEFSGHIFFNDRWYGFDDGLYAAVRLLEILSLREQSLDEILDSLPHAVSTPEIKIAVPDSDKHRLVEQLIEQCDFDDARLITIDGLRVEYPWGWGLVRASNTTAALTLRFEANSRESIDNLIGIFDEQLSTLDPALAGACAGSAGANLLIG
ncbi:MAG: phosphomannomutase/phosphoglucomutase [Porticoccaceae bacterium]